MYYNVCVCVCVCVSRFIIHIIHTKENGFIFPPLRQTNYFIPLRQISTMKHGGSREMRTSTKHVHLTLPHCKVKVMMGIKKRLYHIASLCVLKTRKRRILEYITFLCFRFYRAQAHVISPTKRCSSKTMSSTPTFMFVCRH